MKRVGNIYDNITDFNNILCTYKEMKGNIRNKVKVEKFEDFFSMNIINIKKILESRTYKPGKYNIFIISEPKYRVIMSSSVTDKIVNHLCCKYFLIPCLDRSLLDTNIATRKGMGTKKGILLLKSYLNKVKGTEYYYLKFDISKYFYNINHDILKKKLMRKIKDKDVLKILFDIIDSTDCDYVNKRIIFLKERLLCKINDIRLINEINKIPIYEKGKGLCIGSTISQYLAIFYLSDLDHFIKEKLKIKYHIRYQDDTIILHESRDYLKFCLSEIEKFLSNYDLCLNNKTVIKSIYSGIDFIGFKFVIYGNNVVIRTLGKTKKRFLKAIRIGNNLSGYKGHLQYCTSSLYYLSAK